MKLKKHRSKNRNTKDRITKQSKTSLGFGKIKKQQKDQDVDMNLDMTDKTLQDFKSSKSISVATTIDDVKSSKIGELYDVKPIHDNIHRICQKKVEGRYLKDNPHAFIPKNVSKQLCNCLFEKNSGLRVVDLEKLVKNRMETPASFCINILDKHNHRKTKSRTRKTKSSRKNRSSKHRSTKSKNKN
jgi:hypothetical protein